MCCNLLVSRWLASGLVSISHFIFTLPFAFHHKWSQTFLISAVLHFSGCFRSLNISEQKQLPFVEFTHWPGTSAPAFDDGGSSRFRGNSLTFQSTLATVCVYKNISSLADKQGWWKVICCWCSVSETSESFTDCVCLSQHIKVGFCQD